jgi:hypothetical protein
MGSTRYGSRTHGVVRWTLLGIALALTACVTPAEHRKLERRVIDMERGGKGGSPDRSRVAELGAQIDSMQASLDVLAGRVEVAEHRAKQALEEARSARAAAHGAAVTADPSTERPTAPR